MAGSGHGGFSGGWPASHARERDGRAWAACVLLAQEVDDHAVHVALQVADPDALVAVTFDHLVQQRNRVVVIDEAHGFAGLQRVQRTKDGGMAEALGHATRIKAMNGIGMRRVLRHAGGLQGNGGHRPHRKG